MDIDNDFLIDIDDDAGNFASCEICATNDNVILFLQSIGKQERSHFICRDCAALMGIQKSRIAPRIGDLFAYLFDPEGTNEKDKTICGSCGKSWHEIRHSGQAGCSECYDVFKNEIAFLLSRGSSKNRHRGKLPRRLRVMNTLLIEKPNLRHRLTQALQREDYEDASIIQARIEAIEKGNSQ